MSYLLTGAGVVGMLIVLVTVIVVGYVSAQEYFIRRKVRQRAIRKWREVCKDLYEGRTHD